MADRGDPLGATVERLRRNCSDEPAPTPSVRRLSTTVGHPDLARFTARSLQCERFAPTVVSCRSKDGAFDIGFSNAVVEHVAGGREGQRRFVGELCRVARRVYVTTPNRWFPLDPHTLLPFAHWLPPGPARERCWRARGFDDVLDPLGPRELAALFPYPVRVFNGGLTLIAVGPA